MALRHEHGIVLRGYPFGEADRVVVVLSPTKGRIRVVAKGIRKTKSRFGGRLEPFTNVDLVVYEGRNLGTVTQVAVVEAFPALRADLDRVLAAGAMVEAVDAVAQEDEPSARLFLLLQRGLRTLEARPASSDLLTAFLLKLAAAIGVAPTLDRCAGCGALGRLRFSFDAGGTVCERCQPTGAVRLRSGMTEFLAGLARSDMAALPADTMLSREALGVARRFVEYHLDKRLGALAFATSRSEP
jgi:DNA repair protein RecO (recombination protein O)